jgi:predicted O-methyltransferase YrrM
MAVNVPHEAALTGTPQLGVTQFDAPAEVEATRGSQTHLEFLRHLHVTLMPRLYLEIGIRHGNSLVLATGKAVGVDPAPEIGTTLGPQFTVIQETSDQFFAGRADELLQQPIDLAFIDGLHLFEFALRDFINIERRSHAATVVVFDDVFPAHPRQAQRDRATRVWTGDIWKIAGCLRQFRPDLVLIPLDTWPTGMLLVLGLDQHRSELTEHYDSIVDEFVAKADGTVPADVIDRQGAWNPDDHRIAELLTQVRNNRQAVEPAKAMQSVLPSWR